MQALGRPIPSGRVAAVAAGGARAGPSRLCRRHRRASSSSPSSPSSFRARVAAAAAAAAAASPADHPPAGDAALVDARLRAEGAFVSYYAEIEIATSRGISLHDLTPLVRKAVKESGVADGAVVISSKHTTVAVSVNELEPRLMDDVRLHLRRLAPEQGPWLHNDLHLRRGPEGWPGGDEAWRLQEPENAQAHVQAMLLGASASLSVCESALMVGQWQSVLGVELDGPRRRRFGVGVTGLRAAAP